MTDIEQLENDLAFYLFRQQMVQERLQHIPSDDLEAIKAAKTELAVLTYQAIRAAIDVSDYRRRETAVRRYQEIRTQIDNRDHKIIDLALARYEQARMEIDRQVNEQRNRRRTEEVFAAELCLS